ncbi:MAG TPA: hypothetical protein VNF99_06935 [Stellaceae bacterium]|nr:hypothetical protein [Stellaceae bacterium]
MPPDDEQIAGGAGLLRRVHPDQVVEDGRGGHRPSSGVFRDPKMSVDVEPLLAQEGRDWHFTLRNTPEHSLVRFAAQVAFDHQQIIQHMPEVDNNAHAEVVGQKTGAIRNAFVDAAEWVLKKPR